MWSGLRPPWQSHDLNTVQFTLRSWGDFKVVKIVAASCWQRFSLQMAGQVLLTGLGCLRRNHDSEGSQVDLGASSWAWNWGAFDRNKWSPASDYSCQGGGGDDGGDNYGHRGVGGDGDGGDGMVMVIMAVMMSVVGVDQVLCVPYT